MKLIRINGEYGILLDYIPLTNNYKILSPKIKVYNLLTGEKEEISEKYFIKVGENIIRVRKKAIRKIKNFLQRNKDIWPKKINEDLEIKK